MFKKGNIIRFKCGFWGDTNAPETGRLGVIEYSYGEEHGNGSIYGGYSVLDKETGVSSSWWDEDKLEFVSEGNLYEIEKCYKIKHKMSEKQLSEEEIASLPSDECFNRLISAMKEMSREELIEFYSLTKAYKASRKYDKA